MPPIPSFVMFGYATELSAAAHPNSMKLTGVLVRLDEPSTNAPHGSNGHRIMMPEDVARKRLDTLINMGLNYAPSLKEHAARRKVGVITRAWIDGRNLKIEATIWKKDFPEAERDLKRAGLGMSMEISEVKVADQDANIWVLSDFVFTGATVLEKQSAAYTNTHAMAAARQKNHKESGMKTKKQVGSRSDEDIVRLAVKAATQAGTTLLASALEPVVRVQERMLARLDSLEASGPGDEDEDADDIDAEVEEMKSKKKACAEDDEDEDDEDDEDDMDSEADKGDLEDLGPEEDAGDDEPGHLNRKAANKGRKTASENKVGKTVSSSRLRASMRREQAANEALEDVRAEMKLQRKKIKTLTEQVEAAAQQTTRRSVLPGEIRTLLAKGGVNAEDLAASGQKLSVAEMDAVLDQVKGLSNVKRMEIKTRMAADSLMDVGRVTRS